MARLGSSAQQPVGRGWVRWTWALLKPITLSSGRRSVVAVARAGQSTLPTRVAAGAVAHRLTHRRMRVATVAGTARSRPRGSLRRSRRHGTRHKSTISTAERTGMSWRAAAERLGTRAGCTLARRGIKATTISPGADLVRLGSSGQRPAGRGRNRQVREGF